MICKKNKEAEVIAEAARILNEAPVPTKGRIVFIDGVFHDCDTGEKYLYDEDGQKVVL